MYFRRADHWYYMFLHCTLYFEIPNQLHRPRFPCSISYQVVSYTHTMPFPTLLQP